MEVKDLLLTNKLLNLTEVGRAMWPGSKRGAANLAEKLRGVRPFTKKDEAKALAVLSSLGVSIRQVTDSEDQ